MTIKLMNGRGILWATRKYNKIQKMVKSTTKPPNKQEVLQDNSDECGSDGNKEDDCGICGENGSSCAEASNLFISDGVWLGTSNRSYSSIEVELSDPIFVCRPRSMGLW